MGHSTAVVAWATVLSISVTAPVVAQTREALEEIVITATPLRRTADETAQPATVLAGERLVLQREASIGETLAGELGVTASAFGPIASRPIIRGQGGLRVQTYQDGADTLDVGALSDDHAVSVEPLLVDRIEVIRGPAALLFGSAAAAGAINVVTSRLPLRAPQSALGVAIDLRGDTAAGERGVAARLHGRGGEALHFVTDAHHFSADDLRTPEGRLANSAGESRGGSFGLGWTGDRGTLALSLSQLDNRYGLPGEDEVSLALDQWRFDLSGEWRLRGGFDVLRLRAAYNDYGHFELEGDEIGTRYGQQGSEWRLTLEQTDRLILGAQWRDIDFDAEGEEAFLPVSRTRNTGVFAFREWQRDALTLEAGARVERQTIEAQGIAAPRYADEASSASLGLLWRLATNWEGSLQWTRTGRHPTATELYASGPHLAVRRYEIGDARLGVETGNTIDLGIRRQDEGGWRSSINVFVADYDDFIAAVPEGSVEDGLPVVRFTAIDARFSGVEIEWAHDALHSSRLGTVGVRLFGDRVRARDGAGKPLPQIPPHRIGLEAGLTRGALRFGIDAVWHDAQDELVSGELPTAGFTALSADLSYRMESRGASILWYLRGENLLDQLMRRHASPLKEVAPLAARHLSAGVTLRF